MFTSITLRYIGEALDAESITSSLGVSPIACGNSGDAISSKSGRNRVLKNGFWEWSIKSDIDQSININDQITEFKRAFGDVFDRLNCQPNCSHSWIDLHIIEESENFPISFPISSESMSILNSTNLLLDITISN